MLRRADYPGSVSNIDNKRTESAEENRVKEKNLMCKAVFISNVINQTLKIVICGP